MSPPSFLSLSSVPYFNCGRPLRESAATLEAESGYIMETPEVAEFRRCIRDASWDSAESALARLGVTEGEGLWVRNAARLGRQSSPT